MIRCLICNSDLKYENLTDSEIILICSNPDCNFRSEPIKKREGYLKEKAGNLSEDLDSIERKISIEECDTILDIKGKERVFYRRGQIKEYIILCIDFSNRMDNEIIYNSKFLDELRGKIRDDIDINEAVKSQLLELIEEPLTFFNCILFSLARLILENLKRMEKEEFKSFRIIAMAFDSEELFMFPNFSNSASSELLTEFIKSMINKRMEWNLNDQLTYRDYGRALEEIQKVMAELKDLNDENISIYFFTMGRHHTNNNKFFNPIREIKYKMEDLKPFSFNIINLNGMGLDSYFEQITNRYEGKYFKANTFYEIYKIILKQINQEEILISFLERDYLQKEIDKVISEKPKENFVEEISNIQEKEEKISDENKKDYFKTQNQKEKYSIINENGIKEIPDIKLIRKADEILRKLMEESESE
ncbi:MAG: hypothetical protein ACTSQP_15845 [Promethearchaeota archaeon]